MSRLGIVDFSGMGDDDTPAGFVSPALLSAAHAENGSLEDLAPGSLASARVDRLIAVVPAWCRVRARILDDVSIPTEVIDPWAPTSERALPAYHRMARACHGEVDLAPHRSPVHPWVVPSAQNVADAESRLRHAIAGLAGMHTTRLVLGDERVRWTMDRVRVLATLLTTALRERKSLVELEMRVWPEDLREPTLVDHLALLPIAKLEVLLGTLHAPSLMARDVRATVEELEQVVAEIARVGLAPMTTLNVALALPGETIQQSITALDRALRLAARHGVPAVRCALWLGGAAPIDRDDQRQRFLASHPDWSEDEYRGIHDLVAVIRKVATNLTIIGPGFLPSWDRA